MYEVYYNVPNEQKDAELAWLKTMKIFPAFEQRYNWTAGVWYYTFAAIVDQSVLLTLRLRHSGLIQNPYKPRS